MKKVNKRTFCTNTIQTDTENQLNLKVGNLFPYLNGTYFYIIYIQYFIILILKNIQAP